jgi:hypothetical protein
VSPSSLRLVPGVAARDIVVMRGRQTGDEEMMEAVLSLLISRRSHRFSGSLRVGRAGCIGLLKPADTAWARHGRRLEDRRTAWWSMVEVT